MSIKIDPTDIIGKRFGHLVVTEYMGYIPRGVLRKSLGSQIKIDHIHQYMCHCDCGNDCVVSRKALYGKKDPKVKCGRDCSLTPRKKIKPRIRESKRIGDNAIYWCEYTNYKCYRSNTNNLCCHECDKREGCEHRCLNSPEKCGAPRREDV